MIVANDGDTCLWYLETCEIFFLAHNEFGCLIIFSGLCIPAPTVWHREWIKMEPLWVPKKATQLETTWKCGQRKSSTTSTVQYTVARSKCHCLSTIIDPKCQHSAGWQLFGSDSLSLVLDVNAILGGSDTPERVAHKRKKYKKSPSPGRYDRRPASEEAAKFTQVQDIIYTSTNTLYMQYVSMAAPHELCCIFTPFYACDWNPNLIQCVWIPFEKTAPSVQKHTAVWMARASRC